jgi:hypothetical protein
MVDMTEEIIFTRDLEAARQSGNARTLDNLD